MIERQMENPYAPRTNLTVQCGNCMSLWGYKECGWCRRWETWVTGNADCSEWEARIMEERNAFGVVQNSIDSVHEALSLLGELTDRADDPQLNERFRIAELALLKFLRSFREKFSLSYDEDVDE